MKLRKALVAIEQAVNDGNTTIFAELTLLWLVILHFIWISFFMSENDVIFKFLSIINRQFWSSFFGISVFIHACGFYLKSGKMRILAANIYIFIWFGWSVCWAVVNPNSLLLPSSIVFVCASIILTIRLNRRFSNGN